MKARLITIAVLLVALAALLAPIASAGGNHGTGTHLFGGHFPSAHLF